MAEDKDTYAKLISLVKGKEVFLATHWDCDGVTSGAILYHILKDHAKSINTLSKGDVFLVNPEDIKGKPEVIICSDIRPSKDLLSLEYEPLVIPVDHHPNEEINLYPFSIYNTEVQSCSLLVWNELIQETENPYFIFLALLGYFGDGGQVEDIPKKLWKKAKELIPDMTEERISYYGEGTYLEIQKHVSAMNVGKRMFWSGELPFELLKNIEHHEAFVNNEHPIAMQITELKKELRRLYSMQLNLKDTGLLHYAIIESEKNIQGVLCAKHMNSKPIIVMNKINSKVMGSMRCPTGHEMDAGKYLDQFGTQLESYNGGGHKEAAGFTIDSSEFPKLLDLIKQNAN